MRPGGRSRRARRRALPAALALVAALAGAPVAAARLDATLERNPVRADETVRLILELDGPARGRSPDLDPLGGDFEVLGTTTSTQLRFDEQGRSVRTRWIVELAPRRTGRLVVPPLALDDARSPTLELEVRPAASGAPRPRDIFIEVEAVPRPAYVQAQVRYVVRLYRSVELLEATLEDPAPAGAVVTRLGKGIGFTTRRGGRTYRVVERRYALFPGEPGELRIPGLAFEGEVYDAGRAPSGLGRLFTRGRRVSVRSRPLTVRVLPAPAGAAHPWLPARELRLEEGWSADPGRLRVGTPVTRTITLSATGLRAEQLPELTLAPGPALKTYPDQPELVTTTDARWVRGRRTERVAVVPARPGRYTLPAIRVAWFDVAAGVAREAVVDARTVVVAPAPAPASSEAPAAPAPGPASATAGGRPSDAAGAAVWRALSAALAAGWLLTALAWARARRAGSTRPDRPAEAPGSGAARAELRLACAAGEPARARAALLAWGRAAWPEDPPAGLRELGARLADPALAAALEDLDRALYAPAAQPWRGRELWRIAAGRLRPPAAPRPARRGSPLAPLHP